MTATIIKIPPKQWFQERGINIPGYVFREPRFPFKPQDYAIHHENLNHRIVENNIQVKSLEAFLEDPKEPAVCGVGSEPSDAKALLFAGYLVARFAEDGRKTVLWHSVKGGFFDNKLIQDRPSADLLVLSGIAANSSSSKLEKVRDILEVYSDIPRIVVVAGEDPVTFFSTKLYHKLNYLFFNTAKLVKRKVEVI